VSVRPAYEGLAGGDLSVAERGVYEEDGFRASHPPRASERIGDLHHGPPRGAARLLASFIGPTGEPFEDGVVEEQGRLHRISSKRSAEA
jgi:hypothetical protein